MPKNSTQFTNMVDLLKNQSIISAEHAELMKKENDVNAVGEDGNTALFFAIKKSNLTVIKQLLAAGAKNTINHKSDTPFLHAVRFANAKTIEFFLTPGNLPATFLPQDLLATDFINRNAFHIAADSHDLSAIQLLLKDKRFKNIKNNKDLYGHTPFEVAVFEKQPDIAENLSNQLKSQIQKKSTYGKPPLDIDQDTLNQQLSKYLTLVGRQEHLIIEDGGNCNGWVFLFFLSITLGRKSENNFYDFLNAIASWDGTHAGLQNGAIPSSLKRKFPFNTQQELFNFYENKLGPFQVLWKKRNQHPEISVFFDQFKTAKDLRKFLIEQHHQKNALFKEICVDVFEKYNSMGDLLEQTVNDLSLFQFTTPVVKNLQLTGWGQDWRVQQYQLIKSSSSRRKVHSLFNFKNLTLTQEQLTEYLAYFAQWPDSFIDIGGAYHATALYITPEGKLSYYDPNFSHRVTTFDSPQALAEHIFKYMYRDSGALKDNKITIDSFDGYQFVDEAQLVSAASIKPCLKAKKKGQRQSANGFTPLHDAIMENNMVLAEDIIQKDPLALFATDGHEELPFKMAIRMQNGKCLVTLINAAKKAKLNLKKIAEDIDFEELKNLNPTYIQYLFQCGVLTPSSIDINEKTFLHCALGYQLKFLAKKVMADPKWDVNKKDLFGTTPLMNAAIYNKEIMLSLLDDPKTNPNLTDNRGQNALMHALMNNADHAKALLLKLKNKKSLKFEINIADEDGKTALIYPIIHHTDPLTLKYLLMSGLNANMTDNQDKTALVHALEKNVSLCLMQTLLNYQALDVNKPNPKGLTPLMQGILFKTNPELLSLLLNDKRIQINDIDLQGLTALLHALKNNADKQFILQLIAHPKLNILITDKTGKSALDYAQEHFPDKEIMHAIQVKKVEQHKKRELESLTSSVECLFSNLSIRKGSHVMKGCSTTIIPRHGTFRRKHHKFI